MVVCMSESPPPVVRLITLKQVEAQLGLKRSSIYSLLRRGFPQPLKFGTANRWREDQVTAWICAQNPPTPKVPAASAEPVVPAAASKTEGGGHVA